MSDDNSQQSQTGQTPQPQGQQQTQQQTDTRQNDQRGQHGTRQQGQQQQHRQGQQPQAQQPQQQSNSIPLLDDEEVIINAHPAWSAFMREFLIAALVVLGGIVSGGNSLIGALLIAALIGGYVYWQRQRLRYVVTNRRIMKVTGMGSSSSNEAFLQDVRNLQSGASILERLLGHGHITVSTEIRGSSVPLLGIFLSLINTTGMTLGGINNHQKIANVIRQKQAESKRDS